jgi:mono/diheme cytochrome c family protein
MSPFGSAYGGTLDDTQLDALVAFIRGWETNPPPEVPTQTPTASLPVITLTPTPGTGALTTPGAIPGFSAQILPILQTNCSTCHNQQTKLGGWDASTYSSVMAGGLDGPAVIVKDASNSLLAKKLLGEQGNIMPPSGKLSPDVIQLILDWINSGAPDN